MRTDALTIPILFAFAGIGLYLQFNTYLNQDIAWILYSGRLMLEGQSFGRDIIAPNPPLAWYLSLPPLIASEFFPVHAATTYRIYVALLAAGTLIFAVSFLDRDETGRVVWRHRFFILTLGFFLFIGCYRDFGQREYLSLVLAMPYLLLASARMRNVCCRPTVAIPIGIAAGLGLALKPNFLAVPLAVELLGLIVTRRARFPFRPETWALAVTGTAYAVLVLIAVPHYLSNTVPMVLRIYWGFHVPLAEVIQPVAVALAGLAAIVVFAIFRRPTELQLTTAAAAVGFLIAYVSQMKGYTYHAFPFEALVASGLALAIGQAVDEKMISLEAPRMEAVFATAVAIFLCFSMTVSLVRVTLWYRYENMATGPSAQVTRALIRLVDTVARGESFVALSTHPYPGFPIALYADARWGSLTNSRFFLPAITKLRAEGTEADQELLRHAQDLAYDFLLRDLTAKPRLVLVDSGYSMHAITEPGFDILEFYFTDARIRDHWKHYEELEPVYRYRVFKRLDGSYPR